MISFKIPESVQKENQIFEQIAVEIMRPKAPYYDSQEHEHERPLEFINAIWPTVRDRYRKKWEQIANGDAAGQAPGSEAGPDLSMLGFILMIETMSWGDAGQYLCRPGRRLGGTAVEAVGTPEQKARFLKRFTEGDKPAWGAMAITEPDAGSDNSSMRTTAVLDPDTNEWILNGEKIFITSGSLALEESNGFCVVWATVDPSAGRRGIKSFVVEAGTPGVAVSPGMDKYGIRASDTVVISFNDARIPYDNILGSPEVQTGKTSKGFQGAMRTFDASRPAVAASAVGIARAALEYTQEKLAEKGIVVDYTKPRHKLTAVERDLIDMEAQYKSAWLLTLKATAAMMHGQTNRLEASMCKAHAGTAVTKLTLKAVELLGPLGYTRDFLVEKWMRDAKINDIYEGTRQINLLIVARTILGYSRHELK
ncbi:MAG: acyl-CoA dehydrogenase family protein [Ardenticatenaceae bacterium]|nr:acyl-CoA dehydrogenase family protein [Ardenticatenaceae bacterium]